MVGLYSRRHSLYIPIVASIPLPLPRMTEQISLNKPGPSLPLFWAENRCWKAACKQACKEAGPIPKQNTGDVWIKKRKEFTPAEADALDLNPTISLRLWALGAIVDFGSKNKLQLGHICVGADSTVPRAGPETFWEILEDFLSRHFDWSKMCGEDN